MGGRSVEEDAVTASCGGGEGKVLSKPPSIKVASSLDSSTDAGLVGLRMRALT